MAMDISQGSFLVTGGGSGLGAACVRNLVEAGALGVTVADRDADAASELLQDIGSTRVNTYVTDVTDTEQVKGALAACLATGPLRGVIQCAGILEAGRIVGRKEPHSLEAFQRVIGVNLVGTFNVMRLAAAEMAKLKPCDADGQRGVIINTASVSAFEGQLGQAAYSASKGGVASMTLPAARELGAHGIRVVAIAPGIFDTPMMQRVDPAIRESLSSQVPFPKRFGDVSEFAAMVRSVLENPMVNGSVIRLDGGIRMASS